MSKQLDVLYGEPNVGLRSALGCRYNGTGSGWPIGTFFQR